MMISAGLAIGTLVRFAVRAANLRSRSVAVNLITQATPVLAVTWLLLAGRASVAQPEYLVGGALVIGIANALVARPSTS